MVSHIRTEPLIQGLSCLVQNYLLQNGVYDEQAAVANCPHGNVKTEKVDFVNESSQVLFYDEQTKVSDAVEQLAWHRGVDPEDFMLYWTSDHGICMLNSEARLKALFGFAESEDKEWNLTFKRKHDLIALNESEDSFELMASFVDAVSQKMQFKNCRVTDFMTKWLYALHTLAHHSPNRTLSKPLPAYVNVRLFSSNDVKVTSF